MESIFIEVDKEQMNKDKNVIVGVIHRPPGTNIESFNDRLATILSKIKCENKYLYLLGDFNINLLNVEKHAPSQEFLDLLFSYSLIPTINKPTRVTKLSASLIAYIFE